MAGPPADVSPSELWLKLSEPRPTEVIDFPRKGADGKPLGKVRIQVLTMEDHNRARLAAQAALKKSSALFGIEALEKHELDSPVVREVLGDLTAHELLFMACLRDVSVIEDEDGQPIYGKLFKSPEDLRKRLTADETLVLFNAYLLIQHKWGPFERTLTEDGDVDAWVKRLEVGASEFPLVDLSLPRLVELTFGLSARISSLCHILEPQWQNLPPGLASDLEPYCMGIFSSGELQDDVTTGSSGNLPEISLTDALRMSEKQKNERASE